MRIGQRVLELLDEQKKTQADLARYLNVGFSTVHGWKQENRNPSSELIIPLCTYFNVTSDFLLRGNDTISREGKTNAVKKRLIDIKTVKEGLVAFFSHSYRYIDETLNYAEIERLSKDTEISRDRIISFIDLAFYGQVKESSFPTSIEFDKMMFVDECVEEAAIKLKNRLDEEYKILQKEKQSFDMEIEMTRDVILSKTKNA